MDYIRQLNSYNLKLITEPISPNARSVYISLIDINNKLGWVQEFSISNGRLSETAGLSEQQLNRARQELIDEEYIKYKKGFKNKKAGYYQILQLYDSKSEVNVIVNPNQKRSKGDSKAEALNKLNKTKLNNYIDEREFEIDDLVE